LSLKANKHSRPDRTAGTDTNQKVLYYKMYATETICAIATKGKEIGNDKMCGLKTAGRPMAGKGPAPRVMGHRQQAIGLI
jgi:hypothetical protein